MHGIQTMGKLSLTTLWQRWEQLFERVYFQATLIDRHGWIVIIPPPPILFFSRPAHLGQGIDTAIKQIKGRQTLQRAPTVPAYYGSGALQWPIF